MPTFPETAEIVSTVPEIGDFASDLNIPKNALVAARTCPFSTTSPSLTSSVAGISSGINAQLA